MIRIGDLLSNNRNGAVYRKFADLDEGLGAVWTKDKMRLGIAVPSKRFCGVEIEVENVMAARDLNSTDYAKRVAKFFDMHGVDTGFLFDYLWRKENDGSLRNEGMEFITKLGTTFADASVSVPLLCSYLSIFETGAQANARTGLHVHVDVRDWKLKDLQRLIMIYLVYEQALFDYSGSRQGSLFCVPLAETTFPIEDLAGIHTTDALNALLRGYAKKYMGFNLLPLISQGTVEFRMHKGTINSREINRWLYIISSMFDAAEKFEDNEELKSILLNMQRANLVNEFTKNVFGDAYPFLERFVTPEGVRYGVDKVKEMTVDTGAIPEDYLLPEKKRYRPRIPDEAFDFLRGIEDHAIDPENEPPDMLEPRAFDGPRARPWRVEGRRMEDWRLPHRAENLTDRSKQEIIRIRQEHLIQAQDFLVGLDGSRLPGNEVPPQDRIHPEGLGFFVHRNTTLQVWGIGIGASFLIPAHEYNSETMIFISVIAHWRVR